MRDPRDFSHNGWQVLRRGQRGEEGSSHVVGVVLCFLFASPGFGAPRAVVDQLATLIDNNFYDPVKGRDIASGLRKEASSGVFDAVADPRDLASKLTRKLKPFDNHFNVTWSGQPAGVGAPAASSAEVPRIPAEAQDRRSSYGFRSVQMLPGALGYIDMRFLADFPFGKAEEPARQTADAALRLVSVWTL